MFMSSNGVEGAEAITSLSSRIIGLSVEQPTNQCRSESTSNMVVDGFRNKPSSLSINSILSGEVRVDIVAVEFVIELAAVE